jgi:hypothetical protein
MKNVDGNELFCEQSNKKGDSIHSIMDESSVFTYNNNAVNQTPSKQSEFSISNKSIKIGEVPSSEKIHKIKSDMTESIHDTL